MKSKVISSDLRVLGGAPVFRGTRVTLKTFIDYLEAGESIEDFLEGFPTVSKKQIITFLQEAKEKFFVKA
ncbi:MAG: DUF433 domain-containing protein [Candidatus Omnitrophota bacterium]